jgi:hypothetical protein
VSLSARQWRNHMSKAYRENQAVLYRVARNEVLKSDNPEIWIDRDGLEESLGYTMNAVHKYIMECFNMDDNPLRFLRRYFPDFKWEFCENDRMEKLLPKIRTADYVWVTGPDLFFSEGIITATQIGRTIPRILCYKPEKGRWTDELKTLLPAIRFVIDGSKGYADTIIE